MLHAGLDLSRRKVDVCLLSGAGRDRRRVGLAAGCRRAARPGGARGDVGAGGAWGDRVDERRAVRARPARGARLGGADRRRDQGQGAGAAGVQDRQDRRRVLATLSARDLVPEIWLPDPSIRRERELARFRLHLVRHRTTLKNRIHAALIAFGHPCPVSDLFGHAGRELLDRLQIPDPWRANIDVSLRLIDDLELQIARLTVQLKRQGADHRYIPLLVTAPGIGWINAFTIASEIGDIARFASPAKLCGYTGLCPRVNQSGASDAPRPDLQARPQVPALGAVRGRAERLQAPLLRRALPAHQAPPRPPTRPQGRPDRPRPQAHRGDLAHAHPQPALRSGRCPFSSSRLTAHFGHAPPDEHSDSARSPRPDGAIET